MIKRSPWALEEANATKWGSSNAAGVVLTRVDSGMRGGQLFLMSVAALHLLLK